MIIPVTSLSSYLYCPRKLYLERVLKVVFPPKEAMVKGTIKHQTFDEINKKEEKIILNITKDTKNKEIMEIYKNTYSQILRNLIINNFPSIKSFELNPSLLFKQFWPIFLRESQERSQNILSFIEQNKVYGQELWSNLTPKIQTELFLESKNLRLKGIIDHLKIYPDKYIPYELKSGTVPREGVWPGHRIQIAAYCLLLKDQKDKDVPNGYVKYIDKNEERPILLNPYLINEVKETTNKVIELMNSSNLPLKCNNKNKCEACSLKESCFKQQNN